jgi:hypothetical protein
MSSNPTVAVDGAHIVHRLRALAQLGSVEVADGVVTLKKESGEQIASAKADQVQVHTTWYSFHSHLRMGLGGDWYTIDFVRRASPLRVLVWWQVDNLNYGRQASGDIIAALTQAKL